MAVRLIVASKSPWCRSPPAEELPVRGNSWGKRDSGQWIEGSGFVRRLITDDIEGARHQRFVLDIPGGQTLLIAHNIDIAPRLPVGLGDKVRFRGLYEYNALGGLVHWTHHDPHGTEEGGWVRFRDREYA